MEVKQYHREDLQGFFILDHFIRDGRLTTPETMLASLIQTLCYNDKINDFIWIKMSNSDMAELCMCSESLVEKSLRKLEKLDIIDKHGVGNNRHIIINQ